jgi:hypothetical protein
LLKGFRRPSFDHRAGDVAKVTGTGIAGKNVEDDGLMGAERAGAAFMGITGMDAAGHDRVFGEGASAEAGGFHFDAEPFRGQHGAAPA